MSTRSKFALSFILFFPTGTHSFGHEEDSSYLITELKSIIETTEAVNCLSHKSFRNISALDNGHMLFIGTSRAWVNQLPKKCSSLHRRATFTFEQWSRRICKNTSFSSSRGGDITGQCRLGKFYKIDKRIADRLTVVASDGEFD